MVSASLSVGVFLRSGALRKGGSLPRMVKEEEVVKIDCKCPECWSFWWPWAGVVQAQTLVLCDRTSLVRGPPNPAVHVPLVL